MTRILIVDDHEMIRRGLRGLLENRPVWTVCGEAMTGREAVAEAIRLKPDVIVLDFALPGLNGLEVMRQIRQALPGAEILVYTMHHSEQLAHKMITAGARGFVLKSDPAKVLLAAVNAVRRHKPFYSEALSRTLLREMSEPGRAADGKVSFGAALTPREREVVQLIAEGRSSKEIADLLKITFRTTETHRANIMRKLGLHSVSELVRYAIRNELAAP
jgi:DNA-binding NarL/FixJ family response regulator